MYRVSDVHFGARIYPKIYKSGARRTMSMCSFDYHFHRAMEYEHDGSFDVLLFGKICGNPRKKKRWLKTKKIRSEALALST